MNKPNELTDLQETILRHRAETGMSRNQQAQFLEINPTSLWHVEQGNNNHVSLERRNKLRKKLGLQPELQPVTVMPCRTCGEVHQLNDCHGAKVQHVRRYQKEPERIQDMTVSELASAIRNRVEF